MTSMHMPGKEHTRSQTVSSDSVDTCATCPHCFPVSNLLQHAQVHQLMNKHPFSPG